MFCSRKCSGEFVSKNNPNVVPCAVCGKPVKKKPRELKKQKHVCCSRECLGILRQTIYLGENNPNYGNRGENNPIWRHDERISVYGYKLVRMPDHPLCNVDGFVFEHRLIAEKYLLTEENSIYINGKPYLKREYSVHHIDGNKLNNSVDNLIVLTNSEHMKLHAKLRRQAK